MAETMLFRNLEEATNRPYVFISAFPADFSAHVIVSYMMSFVEKCRENVI